MSDPATQQFPEIHELQLSRSRINDARAKNAENWQTYILPFVGGGLAVLMLIVFGSVLFAGNKILDQVADHSKNQAEVSIIASLEDETFDAQKTQAALISYRSMRHHDRASASLLTRELLRFAAFMIGAALTFVGALFVIGKFADTTPIEASGAVGNISASLTTASPGIFAIVAGASLVAVAVYAHYDINVADSRLTFAENGVSSQGTLTPDQEEDLKALCKVMEEHPLCDT